jgi:hypothetical protein
VLPALIVVGAVTARAGRDLTRRVTSGLLLVGIADVGVYTETRINALVGRSRPPLADWAGVAGGRRFPPVILPPPRCSLPCLPGRSLPGSRRGGLVVQSGRERLSMPQR